MYNVLIVDDEAFVADMLEELLTKELRGEAELFKAYTAKEALAVLERVRIDIVLSDIKMPGMSGLELLERVKLHWPTCKVAFLTGFREFQYVYSAIQYEGVKYLLKTSDDDRILAVIRELMDEIARGHELSGIVAQARAQMAIALPLLQNEWMQQWMDGDYDFPETMDETLKELHIPLNVKQAALMVMGRFDERPSAWQGNERNELRFALQAIAERYFPQGMVRIAAVLEHETMIWLLQTVHAPDTEDIAITGSSMLTLVFGILEYIQATTKATLGTTISFAVSGEYVALGDMREEYRTLKRTLYNRFGMGAEMILSSASNPLSRTEPPSSEAMISLKHPGKFKLLEEHLENGEEEQFRSQLSELMRPVRNVSARNDLPALEVYYRVANMMLSHINFWELGDRLGVALDVSLLLRADAHKSWQDAVDYLLHGSQLLFASQIERASRQADDVIVKLKSYINEHLHDDLSLTKLASLSHLNASYLSRLFKQETGITLSDYIVGKRLSRAKELLLGSNKKMNEISLEVGYESQQSFTRFFKNAEGRTPQEFRELF